MADRQWDRIDWGYTPSGTVRAVVGRSGAPTATKMVASLKGGAALWARLALLEATLRVAVMKAAITDGANVIANEWRGRVHIEDHNYQRAIGVRAARTKYGAVATIAVRWLPDVVLHPGETVDSAQPIAYAARQEFGESGVRRGFWTGQKHRVGASRRSIPSARPAFDHGKEGAVTAVGVTIVGALKVFGA